jgi:hypothetical protein
MNWLKLLALISLSSMSLIFYITFLVAYFNGFRTLVNINNYGEANLELVLATIMVLVSFVYLLVELKQCFI